VAEQSVPSGIAAAAWYDNNVVVQALVANAYERGVAAGRAQAAADIRAEVAPINERIEGLSGDAYDAEMRMVLAVRAEMYNSAAKIAEGAP
jgi:hypothetical protein